MLIATLLAMTLLPQDDQALLRRSLEILVAGDTNRNGRLEGSEVPSAQIARYDRDRDGYADRVEILQTLGGDGALVRQLRRYGGDRTVQTLFAEIDGDQDGALDSVEFAHFLFVAWDRDQDGLLSPYEMTSAAATSRGDSPRSLLARLDRDGNQILERPELRLSARFLSAWDRDGSRTIDLDEIVREEIDRQGGRVGKLGAARSFFTRRPQGNLARSDLGCSVPVFQRIDRDRDGQVHSGELEGYVRELRRQLAEAMDFVLRHDLDGDGQVGPDELEAHPTLFERLDRNGDGFIDDKDRG